MKCRFLLPAEEEMTESAIFYEEKSVGLGSDFLDEVQSAIERICENPKIAAKETDLIRRYALSRFPYSIFFLEEGGEILILAVAHHKRMPGFWKNR